MTSGSAAGYDDPFSVRFDFSQIDSPVARGSTILVVADHSNALSVRRRTSSDRVSRARLSGAASLPGAVLTP